MFVGIRFKDKASNDIEKVNKLLDTAEQSAERLGKQLGLAEKNVNRFGNAGATSTDEFEKNLEDVSDKIVNLQKYLEKYGRAGLNSGNDVEKGSEQANNALNKTKNAANQAADATDEVGDAASSAANDFSNAQTIGVNAWTAIATAITGATIGITNLVAEHDEAMSRIAAKTGLAGKELVGIQDVVNNVFTAGVGSDLATVSDDVVRIKQSMRGLNNQELESFSKQAITISGLWGESSDKITWAVKNMTSNFKGLSEQQALDLITVGFQKTGDYAGDLLDTFKEYSPYFSKMGLSAQEFTGILVSGAQSGAWNLDLVADAVKEFGILSMDGSKTTIAGFKAIGLDADMMANKITQGGESANQAFYATIAGLAAMKDEVKRNEAGLSLFGTKWEDVREDVILAMSGAKTAIQDFEGAAEKATTSASDNVKTKLTSAWRGFQSEMVGIFDSQQGQEAVDSIITGFTSALGVAKDFSGFIVNNWGLVSNTVLGLGTAVGYVAVVMGGMKVIGIVNTLMGMYQASTFASTVATHGFNAALRANPIGLIVTAVGLLITAGVLLYRNWDTAKEKAGLLWQKLLDNPMAALIAGPFGGLIAAGITLYKNFDTIKVKFNSLKTAISNFKVPGWVSSIGGAISGAASKLGSMLDGSHATGLERVPYDGYRAELHRGEAVLTAGQSNALRSAGILSSNSDGTPSLNMETKAPTLTGMRTHAGDASRTEQTQIFNTTNETYENRTELNDRSLLNVLERGFQRFQSFVGLSKQQDVAPLGMQRPEMNNHYDYSNETSNHEENPISNVENRSENHNLYNNTSSTSKSNSISITIPITIQGNADNETVAKLKSTMETTVRDVIARMLAGEIEATEG